MCCITHCLIDAGPELHIFSHFIYKWAVQVSFIILKWASSKMVPDNEPPAGVYLLCKLHPLNVGGA